MKCFEKIAEGIDVAAALEELARLGSRPAAEPLQPLNPIAQGRNVGVVQLYRHPEMAGGLLNRQYVEAHSLLARVREELGQPELWLAVLRILPPFCKIPTHRDGLIASERPRRRRYHLALQADSQSYFSVRQEQCRFASGELWYVDLLNRPHYVANHSNQPRVMLMADTLDRGLTEAEANTIQHSLRAQLGPHWREILQASEALPQAR